MHDALLRLHQVSIDYVDEKDSIDKMRVGTAIGPILAWFFRNTPYFEGRLNRIRCCASACGTTSTSSAPT